MDGKKTLVGIPHFKIPIPLTGDLGIPEIPLFRREQRIGVAKFAAVSFRAQDGSFADSAESYGFSHETDWLFFYSSPGRPTTFGRKPPMRSEEHTSELQSLMRLSYAVFCLKKKNT